MRNPVYRDGLALLQTRFDVTTPFGHRRLTCPVTPFLRVPLVDPGGRRRDLGRAALGPTSRGPRDIVVHGTVSNQGCFYDRLVP